MREEVGCQTKSGIKGGGERNPGELEEGGSGARTLRDNVQGASGRQAESKECLEKEIWGDTREERSGNYWPEEFPKRGGRTHKKMGFYL